MVDPPRGVVGGDCPTAARRRVPCGRPRRRSGLSETRAHGASPVVTHNVADAASPPSAKAAKAPIPTTWTAEELVAFLEATRSTRLGPLWALYAATGLRRAGALERRWSDLDFDTGQLTVGEKGGKSHSIALDVDTIAVMRGVRKRRAAETFAWGPPTTTTATSSADGVPYSPDLHHPGLSRNGCSRRAAADPASRSAPHLGDVHARSLRARDVRARSGCGRACRAAPPRRLRLQNGCSRRARVRGMSRKTA
jgi:integrase